jgi:quaternary ammonium compound-resistance protein SugE
MNASMSPSTAWLILLAAGVLEIVWSVSMKASAGFTRVPLTIVTFVAAWCSFILLGIAMKALPVGNAYAVWTGIGAVGAAIAGIALFHEPATVARMGCIALIVAGIVGLRLAAGR